MQLVQNGQQFQIESVATFLIILGARMKNLLIVKVKIVMLTQMLIRVSPVMTNEPRMVIIF